MRAVNLLPPEYRAGGRRSVLSRLPAPLASPPRLVSIVAAVVLAVVLAAGYVTQSRTVGDRQQTLDALQAELAARPMPEPAATPASDASVRLAAATAASSARVPWEEVLHQFSLVLPADVSITSLTASGSAGPPDPATGVASGFTISGYTVSQPSVARLLVRLAEAPALANVQLQSSMRVEREGGRAVIEFSIAADIVAEGGAS